MDLVGAVLLDGLRWGALWSAFGLGLRHGFDWDHIAALTDITSSQDDTRRSLVFSTLYILGHASVLSVLGLAAVLAGSRIPSGLDAAMGRAIGATLIVLGVYVLVALVRHGRDMRLRSRWMVTIDAARAVSRWWRARRSPDDVVVEIEHDHEHPASAHHHGSGDTSTPTAAAIDGTIEGGRVAVATTHRHAHRHRGRMPDDPFVTYGSGTAFGVGMLHGIGAETPTQMLLFVTAAGAGGALAGSTILVAFVVGLMLSNTVVAVLSRAGVLGAGRNAVVFVALTVAVAAVSLYLGTVYLFDLGGGLPALFA